MIENNRIERIWKLAQADFRSRYYNDRLGLLWALIKPIFEVGIYFVVFKMGFRVAQENFVLFLFCGLIVWMIFSESTKRGMSLLTDKLYLIENVQLKRIDLYISFILSIFIAFTFNFIVFLGVTILSGNYPGPELLFFPVVLVTIFLLSMGMVLILSCIQPFLNDLNHFWDMLLLLGFWVSGIFYHFSMLTEVIPWMYYANPFIGIIHNMRAFWIDGLTLDFWIMGWNLLYSIIIFFIGWALLEPVGSVAIEKL